MTFSPRRREAASRQYLGYTAGEIGNNLTFQMVSCSS